MRAKVAVLGALGLLCTAGFGQAADAYVRVSGPRVPVRDAADAKSTLVGYARRDDVFQLKEAPEGWFGIVLFSGDVRYIPAAQARKSAYSPSSPPELGLRRELFRAFAKADTRAKAEAEKKSPSDFGRHQRLLEDRYKLEVVQRYRLPPPVYGPIQKEGAQAGWR